MRPLPAGVVLVPGSHIELCGVVIPVANASFSEADIITTRVAHDADGQVVWFDENGDLNPRRVALHPSEWRPTPEAYHLTLLCGENGRWVELVIFPEQEHYTEAMVWDLPVGPTRSFEQPNDSAAEVLAVWRAECARSDPLEGLDEYDDPFCGVTPGYWDPLFFEDTQA